MKVREIIKELVLKTESEYKNLDGEVSGVYCCDLLSWVMSHAAKGNIWITVQVHPNIVAVASLLELSCIIIPEDIEVEKVTMEKSLQEDIPILKTSLNSFELCAKLSSLKF